MPEPLAGEPEGGDAEERGLGIVKILVLVAALAFLLGAAGYFVGARQSVDDAALSEVDEGFLVDMSAHHDQAVEMALLELACGENPVARDFAIEVVMLQRKEIGIMETLLDVGGAALPEYDPERTVMAWMDMPTPLAQMPGMASEADMDALEALCGIEGDELFLRLMREHHRGGMHMGDYAAEFGSNEQVRVLAARMARNQRLEVDEYTRLLESLGYE